MMLNDDSLPVLRIATKFLRADYVESDRCPQKLEVFPDDEEWTYSLLLCFINEQRNYINDNHSFIIKEKDNVKTACFRFNDSNNRKFIIYIKIASKIHVFVSTLLLRCQWVQYFSYFESRLGADNKTILTSASHLHSRFVKCFTNISMSSRFFIEKNSIIYFSKYDFNKILHFFAKRINKFGYIKNIDSETLSSYINSWCGINKKVLRNFEDLKIEGVNGFIKLILQPKLAPKRLPTFSVENVDYYIVGGVFIMPQAKSLIENNPEIEINGYLLDTTWKIQPMFVTSILTACFMNTSLPIGFTFSNGETKESYEFLLNVIESQISIDFTSKIFESDQGKALLSLFQGKNIIHLKCIRHLIAGLKYNQYAYEIGQLVQCSSQFELDNCFKFCEESFTEICQKNSDELNTINKSLEKVGLFFSFEKNNTNDPNHQNKLEISNEELWDHVSKFRRIKYKMPSTTNSLEAMHGHMNKRTPRRNTFFQALLRIHDELSAKYNSVEERIRHNYNEIKRKTRNKHLNTPIIELDKMCTFYSTTMMQCKCGENKLESANFNLDIPCHHRLYKGASFPSLPKMTFDFTLSYDELIIDEPIYVQADQNSIRFDRYFSEKDYIIKTIRFFSKYKNVNQIKNFVETRFRTNENRYGIFIRNQDISIIQVVEEGIHHFQNIRLKMKNGIK